MLPDFSSSEDVSPDSTTSQENTSEVLTGPGTFLVDNQETPSDPRESLKLSNRSEAIIELVIEEGTEDEEYLNDDNEDGDSLDEGLGDTSSDETAESPVPNRENTETNSYLGNRNHEGTSSTPVSRNEKERRPSRISLETPL